MGDCDSDLECEKELVCGVNNCKHEFSHEGSYWNWYDDCCTGWYLYPHFWVSFINYITGFLLYYNLCLIQKYVLRIQVLGELAPYKNYVIKYPKEVIAFLLFLDNINRYNYIYIAPCCAQTVAINIFPLLLEYVPEPGFSCQPLLGGYSSFSDAITDCSRNLQCRGVVQRWGHAKYFNFCDYSAETVKSVGGSVLYRKSKSP